jgi:hypothetical protein
VACEPDIRLRRVSPLEKVDALKADRYFREVL